jgi:hypothetical protein
MYTIKATGEQVKSFMGAISIASAIGSEIVQENGSVCWEPAPGVAEWKIREYREHLAARIAYLESVE